MKGETKVSLKLLVDTEGKRVLFAEASKDFVDFLFHIMTLPVGAIVKLLKVYDNTVGCLGDLYKSIESLKGDYLQADANKDDVLNPKATVNVPLLSLTNDTPKVKSFYRCSNHTGHISDDPKAACPNCRYTISTPVTFVAGPTKSSTDATSSSRSGYVKEVLIYMVMDNLEVKPMSNISAISLLNKFHVKDFRSLVEKEVQLGFEEGIAILKASLETRAVLTTVFFGKKVYGFKSS